MQSNTMSLWCIRKEHINKRRGLRSSVPISSCPIFIVRITFAIIVCNSLLLMALTFKALGNIVFFLTEISEVCSMKTYTIVVIHVFYKFRLQQWNIVLSNHHFRQRTYYSTTITPR